MQQYPLVGLGDLERLADLLGVPALDVAHQDHEVLALGQLAIAASIIASVSRASNRSSGSPSQLGGNRFQPPG